MPIGWRSHHGGSGRLDENVERINEIANGLAAVSLAMQAEEPETARATADETLWQASQLLSEAVAQAEARARRRRTVTRVATATAAVAAAAAIAISLPEAGPSFDQDRLAGDEVPSEVRHLEAWGHPAPGSLRDREAVSPPETVAVVPARLHLEREALPPLPPVAAGAPDEDDTTITAAAPPDAVGDAPTPPDPEDTDGVDDDEETEPVETHPGVLASGRAQPSERSMAGAGGPPGHATVTTGAGGSAGGAATDA